MSNTNQTPKYFNVITSGIGYLNRARIVSPNGGKSFLAVTVALMEGSPDDVRYVYLDQIVKGEKAKALVTEHMDAICDDNTKVIAAVECGSLRVAPFIYERGNHKGKPGAALKSSLLKISYLKIGGNVVHLDKSNADQDVTNETSVSAEEREVTASTFPPFSVNNTAEGDSVVSNVPAQAATTGDDAGPKLEIVKLDKNEPNFLERKSGLKNSGYRWDSSLTAWVRPLKAA